MLAIFKKGFSALPIIAIVLVLFGIFTIVQRRYIYFTYQTMGQKLGINLNNIATDSYVNWIRSQSENYSPDEEAIFLSNPVLPNTYVATGQKTVLGESISTGDEKWIEIDLSEQRLYMKEGDRTVNSFLISSGKWAPTPKGEWRIWIKLRSTRMRGGSKALGTYYDLPNVPYTMYYYQGYGIHGAYWHNNFGQPMSHGCVNMRPEEAGIVFNWASVGTRVVVHA